jgi:hypothetical protein
MDKNLRIKIITVAFAACYCLALGESIITDFVAGLKEGYQIGSEWAEVHKDELNPPIHQFPDVNNMLVFQARPKALNMYPTVLKLVGGSFLPVRSDRFYTFVENPVRPTWIKVAHTISSFFLFLIVGILIFIPIQVGKVIRSIIRNEIFDVRNVRRLRLSGYALLIVFALSAVFGYISTIDARNLVHPLDYNIIFSLKEDYIYLLFGLATLLFAEILKISHGMKVENDLTV